MVLVGIGASAGGVEAFRDLFERLPPRSGLAILLLLHLPSQHKSMLREIVQVWTKIPVVDVEDGTTLAEDVIHVVPPHTTIQIRDDVISLVEKKFDESRVARPIDALFDAIATSYQENAIAVVLSGTGTDGALGTKAVKALGGLTIAQGSNSSAPQYADMPAAAIATGAVDLILPIEEIPAALMRNLPAIGLDDDAASLGQESYRLRICEAILTQVGHDFSGYRDKTFNRRVRRRMQALGIDSVGEYVSFIEGNQAEAAQLFRDLLIRVTSFFRDPEIFDALSRVVVPRLFENANARSEIRIWVPGCATGEEAYSLAIMIREYMNATGINPRVQIFATDIDDPAVGIARLGRYPPTLLKGLSAARLKRFFYESDSGYVVAKEIRELCTFAPHSLVRDPPFSRMNLVSCRNLLIYFDTALQERIIPLFHYSLVKGGILLLGSSESTSRHQHLFDVLDKNAKIFVRRNAPVARFELPGLHPRSRTLPGQAASKAPNTGLARKAADTHQNRQSHSMENMTSGQDSRPRKSEFRRFLNRMFGASPGSGPDLSQAHDELKSLNEQHQTTLEELRSTNEELHSVNEEMQSTNEELETSKEELQSVNEELRTVNLRLSEKVQELDAANSDLRNLFESTEIATVFLDKYLLIRSFTPAIANLYNLIPTDNGRPITDIKSRLAYDSIREDVDRVLKTLKPFERRVERADGGGHFMMRILPYRNPDSSVDGTLVTFVDITSIVQAEAALRAADERKDVFLATLSHELRNPLAPIRTAAGILANPNLSAAEVMKVQAIISRQAKHMSSLLDDLLDLSRITRGALVLKKQYVQLDVLLTDAIEILQSSAESKSQRLIFDATSCQVTIEVDPVRITQIFTNLVSNAIKYTPSAGVIEVTCHSGDTGVVLTVKDTGIGLAADQIDRVFDMFTQIDPRVAPAEGMGIGLALVKGLVWMHDGTITARSAGLGEGSEFIVWFPPSVICLNLREQRLDELAKRESGLKRILIADDNTDGAEALEMYFKMEGHEVRRVHNGAEALESAALFRPDIAILDIGMPGMSGYEVAQQIRREAWGEEIVLIALTGWGQDEDKRRTRAAGFDHHLTKPVDPSELANLLG